MISACTLLPCLMAYLEYTSLFPFSPLWLWVFWPWNRRTTDQLWAASSLETPSSRFIKLELRHWWPMWPTGGFFCAKSPMLSWEVTLRAVAFPPLPTTCHFVHPKFEKANLTWKKKQVWSVPVLPWFLNMDPENQQPKKRRFLLETSIFGFHVELLVVYLGSCTNTGSQRIVKILHKTK